MTMKTIIIDITQDDDDDDDGSATSVSSEHENYVNAKMQSQPVTITNSINGCNELRQIVNKLEVLESMSICAYCNIVLRYESYDTDYIIFACCGRIMCNTCSFTNRHSEDGYCNYCQ